MSTEDTSFIEYAQPKPKPNPVSSDSKQESVTTETPTTPTVGSTVSLKNLVSYAQANRRGKRLGRNRLIVRDYDGRFRVSFPRQVAFLMGLNNSPDGRTLMVFGFNAKTFSIQKDMSFKPGDSIKKRVYDNKIIVKETKTGNFNFNMPLLIVDSMGLADNSILQWKFDGTRLLMTKDSHTVDDYMKNLQQRKELKELK